MITPLKKELSEAGYEFSEIVPELIVIENFISQKEISDYFKIIDQTTEEQWSEHYLSNLRIFCMEKFGRDDVDNLVKEGKFEITLGWEDKVINVSRSNIDIIVSQRLAGMLRKADPSLILSGFGTIQRMQKGTELKSHTDQHTDPSIRYAAVLYLNDNYLDGEIFFENKGISIKPSPGSLLIFPGNEEFKHGVKHVGDGPIRYVLPGFIKVKDFYKHNKY